MDEFNPFQSPAVPVEVVPEENFAFRYMRPFSYIFENPKWVTNVLLLGVVQFIPIVGPLAMIGYQYEVVMALLRRPTDEYPDFDFNRFTDYMKRGVWPFLVMLVWGMVLGAVMSVLVVAGAVAVAATSSGNSSRADAEFFGMIFMGVTMAVAIFGGMGLQVIALPLMLRSGLQKDFASGFSLGFAFQFLGNTWKEMIVAIFLLTLAALAAVFVGLMLFCVGQYFTMAIIILAQCHVLMQLYRLHVSRGGQTIALVD